MTPGIEFVGALDVYENSHEMLEDTQADVVLVACEDGAEQVPAFIAGAIRQQPDRPGRRARRGTPNGFVRKVFEAGADDIVVAERPDRPRTTSQFAIEKAVARRSRAPPARPPRRGGDDLACSARRAASARRSPRANLAVRARRRRAARSRSSTSTCSSATSAWRSALHARADDLRPRPLGRLDGRRASSTPTCSTHSIRRPGAARAHAARSGRRGDRRVPARASTRCCAPASTTSRRHAAGVHPRGHLGDRHSSSTSAWSACSTRCR